MPKHFVQCPCKGAAYLVSAHGIAVGTTKLVCGIWNVSVFCAGFFVVLGFELHSLCCACWVGFVWSACLLEPDRCRPGSPIECMSLLLLPIRSAQVPRVMQRIQTGCPIMLTAHTAAG
jgi:hypothetical protein